MNNSNTKIALNTSSRTAPPTTPHSDGHSVLVITIDNDLFRRIHGYLTPAGFHVRVAANAQQVLADIETNGPKLVILDQHVDAKNKNPLDALHKTLRAAEISFPVIALCDSTLGATERDNLVESGAHCLLPHSCGPKEILNAALGAIQSFGAESRERGMAKRFRKTEYEYQELIENVNDLIFTLDLDGRFSFVNRQLLSLVGHHREDWIGRSLLDLVVADDKAETDKNLQETLRGKAKIFEMRVMCADEKTRYFSANINPIFEKGKIAGVAGIARDTTQRKKLEQEIVDLKNFNESIIQSMQSGLITLDLENKITSFNAAAEEILGCKAEEVNGQPLKDILPEEDCLKILPNIVGPGHSLLNRELTATGKSGKKIHIGFSVAPRLDDNYRRVGTIISFRDISEIKRLQSEMIRMDRLASLGVLASGIAHEIKNPLAGIKTMAQSMEEEIEPSDQRREYLERIVRQVDRLDGLLKTFFSFARPRSPLRKPYKLQEIIQEVTALVGQKLKSRNINFETNYEPNLPAVYVDFDQIQQVFLNLLLNAMDAIHNDGVIELRAKHVRTSLKAVDRRRSTVRTPTHESLFVQAELSDSGGGIAPEDLSRIFDPFFTTKPQGSGLGLAIVYSILAEHGGEIRAESDTGRGTTFTVLIPTEE